MGHKTHGKIHKKLRKHAPESVEKAKKFFSFKYPKLFILISIIFLTYYLFSQPFISEGIKSFNFGNLGVFISGALTSFGFTAPLGVGLLTKMHIQNILVATLIGGIGATIADLLIFKTIKFSFIGELKKLEKTKVIREIEKIVKKNKHVLIRHYLMYIFAGILLITPLPDELAVSMFAGLTTIKLLRFGMISFVLHASAIFVILSVV